MYRANTLCLSVILASIFPNGWISVLSFGIATVYEPQGSVDTGMYDRSFIAAGLKFDGSVTLLTKGSFNVFKLPLLHAADAKAVKSPERIAAVGTYRRAVAGRVFSIFF